MKDNFISTFIKQEREKQDLNIQQLSKSAGVPWSTIKSIETGKVYPQIVTTEKLLNALGYELIFMKRNLLEDVLKENN